MAQNVSGESVMPDVSGPGDGLPHGLQPLSADAGSKGSPPHRELAGDHRVSWGFIAIYTLALLGTSLVFLAPLLVTLALKVNSLVGIDRAPSSLGLVSGIASLLAMVGNPFFGKLS